jgi:hypothetical protein
MIPTKCHIHSSFVSLHIQFSLTQTPKPHVGSLVTGRSVCNDASAKCKGVARAVVADEAALEARKKSKAAKGSAANATAAAADGGNNDNENNNKRSKELFSGVEARANQTEARRSLGDTVDGAVGDVTGVVGDVADTVGLKTRDGNEVRAEVADEAALEARKKSKDGEAAAAAASNSTAQAEARRDLGDVVTDEAALDARANSKGAKGAASNGTATASAGARRSRRSRKFRKARRSRQLW